MQLKKERKIWRRSQNFFEGGSKTIIIFFGRFKFFIFGLEPCLVVLGSRAVVALINVVPLGTGR